MKKFTSVKDVDNIEKLVSEGMEMKKNPYAFQSIGKNKTLGLIFLNPSLRTRMSTQKAGENLGMNVQIINAGADTWAIEYEEKTIMNSGSVEHIKDAAKVLGKYCDILGVRCFAGLKDKKQDYSEHILDAFVKYSNIPVISLESSTLHPLQSLADLMTIRENWSLLRKPKVVLSWAPHVKPLPQAVPNSFAEWMSHANVDFCIANPEGYDLSFNFTANTKIYHCQREALEGADFVYIKNWSSFQDYGKMPEVKENWLIDEAFWGSQSEIKFMHCLPVRRNLEMADSILDSPNSLIYHQAENRVYAAQAVIKRILENFSK